MPGQLVFYNAADPAAGVIGQAFRIAGMRARGETRAAVASAHATWHEAVASQGARVGGVGRLTPSMVAQIADQVASHYGVGRLVSDSMGVVVGQAQAQAAMAEAGVQPGTPGASYVQQAAEQLRLAFAEGRADFRATLQTLLDHAPTSKAAEAIQSIAHEMGTTVRALEPTIREAEKAAREIGKAPGKVAGALSAATVATAVAVTAVALMIFLRTK